MEPEQGYAYLRLDKDWDMDELSRLSRLYIQCYSFVFSLSGFQIQSEDERAIDWFQGAYSKYPWRGGYSALNFYHTLYAKVPYDYRPQIEEIHYASPGHIKLKEAVVVASLLAGIVAAVTTSIDNVLDTYNKIHKGMADRELSKIEVKKQQQELDAEKQRFISESKEKLLEKMDFPPVMRHELERRTEGNDLMALKILMSFERRVEPIAEMQKVEMLKVEEPAR